MGYSGAGNLDSMLRYSRVSISGDSDEPDEDETSLAFKATVAWTELTEGV